MAQKSDINLKFFASGFCRSHANIADPKHGKGKEKFYAIWALIQLSNVGYIMFDTGYNNEFQKATQTFPERLYRWITPVTVNELESAKNILKSNGIDAIAIKYIIISHFHADHISGLKDFPNAQFICSKDAYAEVETLSGIKAIKKGIVHKLLPLDFNKRVLILETIATKKLNNYGEIEEYQIFNNQSFSLIMLPGHAKGMLGFIYKTENELILYGADASWNYNTFKQSIYPRKIVKLFFDSWKEYIKTQQKIKAYETKNKQVKVLFTHCKQTLKYISG